MKKIIALVLALVLSLALCSVAFALDSTTAGPVKMKDDSKADYHKPAQADTTDPKNALVKLWACFDGGKQSAEVYFGDNTYLSTDGYFQAFDAAKTIKGGLYTAGQDELEILVSDANDDAAMKAAAATYFASKYKTVVMDLTNAKYVDGDITVTPIIKILKDDDGFNPWIAVIEGFEIAITPKDLVIANNEKVTGTVFFYDNNALTTSAAPAFKFEIELRNHYVNVKAPDAKGNATAPNNASYDNKYTTNDIQNVIKVGKALNLFRHYDGVNTSAEPSYVIAAEQLATCNAPAYYEKAFSVAYAGKVTVTFADVSLMKTGINFKYAEVEDWLNNGKLSRENYLANKGAYVYAFQFLSTTAMDVATTVEFDAAKVAAKGKDFFLYYSADGKEYTKVATGKVGTDKAAADLKAGDVLGAWLLSDTELTIAGANAEAGKENVGTGASDMVSVAVAMAVVSLVAAGAVCIKKVTK